MDKTTHYTQAPLPFQGQKRQMRKEIIKFASQQAKATLFVDMFGGSGFVSQTIKQTRPECTVIYNDFDNYTKRLKNIPTTNKILSDIKNIITAGHNKPLTEPERKKIIQTLEHYEQKGAFVDYITISASICYPLHYTQNLQQTKQENLYNRTVAKQYSAKGYLNGVKTVHADYKTLFKKYKDDPTVLFVLDPPYLQTNESGYYKKNMWTLAEHLDILTILTNKRWCYFTSSKSDIIQLIEWMNKHSTIKIKYKIFVTKKMAGYTDYMIVSG